MRAGNGTVTAAALALLVAFCTSAGAVAGELHSAVRVGAPPADVERLLARGANVNAPDAGGISALHWAVYENNRELVQLLTAHGADLAGQDRNGTPLHAAALRGHRAVAALLIDAGADVNARHAFGGTPLHFAASAGHTEVARLLLARGADPNAVQNNGKTAGDVALATGHADVAALLGLGAAAAAGRHRRVDAGSQRRPPLAASDREVVRRQASVIRTRIGTGDWRIQLGAFRRGSLVANRHWERLRGQYPELLQDLGAHVERTESDSAGALYRLQAGPLTEADARRACAELKRRRQGCWVLAPGRE